MTYQRASEFDTRKPEALQRDLQQMDRAIEAEFRALKKPMQWESVRKVVSDTTARFGELLVCDTDEASIVVTLPKISSLKSEPLAVVIGVIRKVAANSLTIRTVGDDEINGGSSVTLGASGGVRALIQYDGERYWL